MKSGVVFSDRLFLTPAEVARLPLLRDGPDARRLSFRADVTPRAR